MKQNLNTPDNDKINIQGNNAHPIIDSANGGSMLKLSNTVWIHIEINIHKGIYFNENIANLYLEFLIIINSINKLEYKYSIYILIVILKYLLYIAKI